MTKALNQRSLRVVTTLLFATILFLMEIVPTFAADGTYVTFPGHMAGTNGNAAYYAVGIDGGGPLYKYNTSTGSKKKIAKGKWSWLNVRGKKIYLAKNNYGGSDGRDYYIYSMSTNGKNRKKLANGRNPVVRGKYIYYIAVKKQRYYGTKMDGSTKGIYRMKLNGKGKKCLLKMTKDVQFDNLGVTSDGLVYIKDGKWYKCNFNGKNSRQINTSNYTCNLTYPNYRDYGWDYYTSYIDVKNGSHLLSASGNTVYSYNAANSSFEGSYVSVSGSVKKIIVSGKHVMVVSHTMGDYGYEDHYNVYMMTKDGKNKKRVKRGYLVSGGWDY